jgi:hypothetical protein
MPFRNDPLPSTGRSIRTTAEHPFWVEGKGWVDANKLQVGDRLLGADGEGVAVEGVEGDLGGAAVYNVQVEDYHTYFVGDPTWGFSVWAHNANCFTYDGKTHNYRNPPNGQFV